MKIVMIANGEINSLEFLKQILDQHEYAICADGAAQYFVKLESVPDLLVGDFDSIDKQDFLWMKENGAVFKKFPARKDFTDSELALNFALEMKPTEITLIGGVGSRWDHSLSNIMFLDRLLKLGIKAKLMNEKNLLTITQDFYQVTGSPGDIVSIVPLSEAVCGVTLKGLEYPLTDHDFSRGSSLGISNRLVGNQAEIWVKEGILLVYQGREDEPLRPIE